MASASWILLISAALFQICHCGDQEFQSNSCGSFLVPRHVLSGTNSVVWISSRKPENFTLRILDETILLEDKIFIEELTPIEFQLPVEIKRGSLSLQIFTDCNEKGENCSLCDDYSMQVLSGEKKIEIQLESSVYEAGDTVSIWVAMIDHSGNANFDLATDVVVKDPGNFTVKIWRNVQLHFGVGNFQMELSKGAAQGSWTVIARSQRNQFFKQFHVRDRTAATSQENRQENEMVKALGEPHFVEINFSSRTRFQIYENLPFIGELITKTSEKGILVRLELLDLPNQTILYNSTVEFGKTHSQLFIIPALESLPENISMQAVLESIEGQPVDNKFILATRQLDVNMNKTCQFQLFPTSAKYDFQEGELLNILLSSSCPFSEGKINYVITSDSGHVTAWGQEFLAASNVTEEEHFVNLTITITESMKPSSLISVFSVIGDGLILQDSFQVRVRPKEEKERIHISSGVNDVLKINITKAPGEMQCLIGSWESGSDAKLTSLVNITQPNWLDTSKEENNNDVADTVLFGLAKDTWMVQCLEPTETTWEEIDIPVVFSTEEASLRTLQVFSIDVTGKIRPSSVYSMEEPRKPSWELDFQLPSTVRLGEELIIDVGLHSNLENCSQTQLHMALKGGAIFSANHKKFLSQPACLAPKSKTTYRVGVELTELGSLTLTVQVKGSTTNSCCGLSTAEFILLDGKDEVTETTTQSKTTEVLEGGFINKKKESYLFCLDGIDYNTNGSFNDAEAFYLSATSKSIVFQVAAAGDIRIALHKEKATAESAYHFVLGGDDNSLSWISFGSNSFTNILQKVATPKLLRSDKLQTFWISWDSKKLDKSHRRRRDSNGESLLQIPKLSLGRGFNVGARTLLTVLLEGLHDFNYGFHYVNFAAGAGTPGYFRIWGLSGGSEQTTSTLQLSAPASSSLSSARAEIALIGGLTVGLENLYDQLRLAGTHYTLVAALEEFFYKFERAFEDNVESKLNLDLCVQNIVKFRAQEGYFHNGDNIPSQRLTALAVRALQYLARVMPIDLGPVTRSLKWLHRVQNENGSFTSTSSTVIAETSYVVSTLTDFQYEDLTTFQVVSAAQRFLEQELVPSSEMNSIVQVSSAIVLSRSSISIEAERKLDSVFQELVTCLNNDAGCLDVAVDALAAYFHVNKPHHYLTLSKLLMNARWEILHSTERIKAFLVWSKYGKLLAEPLRNLQVHITFQTPNEGNKNKEESGLVNYNPLEESQMIHINSLPLRYDVPQLPQTVQFSASGTGCITLQNTVTWITPMPPLEEQPLNFTIDVDLRNNQSDWSKTDPPEQLDVTLCIKTGNGSITEMILEIFMPSSYIIKQLRALSSDSAGAEINNGVGLVYVKEMASSKTSCYEVNSLRQGLVRNLQPGRILANGYFGQRIFIFHLN